jgi:hypothetical protein
MGEGVILLHIAPSPSPAASPRTMRPFPLRRRDLSRFDQRVSIGRLRLRAP